MDNRSSHKVKILILNHDVESKETQAVTIQRPLSLKQKNQ
jgi:hypothetical protein